VVLQAPETGWSGVRRWQAGPMELDPAQLSSLSSSLTELQERLTRLAEGFQGSPREDVAADLFEVERLLQGASRRLQSLVRKVA
jgi:hypothetical protein